jgi:hypothetical protein
MGIWKSTAHSELLRGDAWVGRETQYPMHAGTVGAGVCDCRINSREPEDATRVLSVSPRAQHISRGPANLSPAPLSTPLEWHHIWWPRLIRPLWPCPVPHHETKQMYTGPGLPWTALSCWRGILYLRIGVGRAPIGNIECNTTLIWGGSRFAP